MYALAHLLALFKGVYRSAAGNSTARDGSCEFHLSADGICFIASRSKSAFELIQSPPSAMLLAIQADHSEGDT